MTSTLLLGHLKAFLVDRLRTLRPTNDIASPWELLGKLKVRQWLYLILAFLAWTWDAFDFYSISTVIPELTLYFGETADAMTLGLTISLIPRFLGAAIFGMASDRYGRKWPFVVDCLLLFALELCLAFCTTYTQFIVCRALFGIAMGGMYGNATATALEDCPEESRGIVAGIFQAGYPTGFLLATAFWRAFNVEQQEKDWKNLFYFASCPPLILLVFRICLKETNFYEHQVKPGMKNASFLDLMERFSVAFNMHWKTLLYLIALMFGCTFLSHGSEDVYPLMLGSQYKYTSNQVTTTQIVAYVGAVIGSGTIGFGSQIIGRRFSIIAACFLGAVFIYPYCFVSGPGLYPIVFVEQFLIQGIFGIIPIHLMELSDETFRSFIVGTSYNLGVLLASWVPEVETLFGERRVGGGKEGGSQYNIVMADFLSCGFIYTMIITFLGKENREGRHGSAQQNIPDPNEGRNNGDIIFRGADSEIVN